ncbi:MAG: galactose oxidase-like domain-containing protein [Halioglobus sp.]
MNRFRIRLLLFCLLPLPFSHASAQSTISGQDFYSPIVEWQQASGREVTPIHAALLPTGEVLFVSYFKFFANPELDLTTPGLIPEFSFVMDPSPVYTEPPATRMIVPEVTPLPSSPVIDQTTNTAEFRSLICGGHSLMADGSLFFASGADVSIDLDLYFDGQLLDSLVVDGLTESLSYDPFSRSWVQNPDTIVKGPQLDTPARWYATVTRLADSRMLVTGGYEKVLPEFSYNNSVEIFEPDTNAWTVVSDLNDTPPGIENPDYTHVFQYPSDFNYVEPNSGNTVNLDLVLMIGGSAEPLFLMMDGPNKIWHHTQQFRPGAKEFIDASAPKTVFPNHGSSTAMLPLRLPESSWGYTNGSLMNVGGAHMTPMEGNIDVFDPGLNAWLPSVPMGGLRHHASTVILPDGRILILGGHDDMSAVKQTGLAQYVDPKNNFEVSNGLAVMPETRGYHTVALLLPDGRVLLGGGNPAGQDGYELPNFRYYYPDYMFEPRPQLSYVQDTMQLTNYSIFFVPHLTNVDEATLIGLGSMTHSFDMSQRSIQLRMLEFNITIKLESGSWVQVGPEQCVDDPLACFDVLAVQTPDTAEIAPPGYYMFSILDENRIPSVSKIVKLVEASGS